MTARPGATDPVGLIADTTPSLRAIGLAGPTASGKSALALAAAARWPLE